MTVGELLDRMGSAEFAEWMAYYGVGMAEDPSAREAEGREAMALFRRYAMRSE